jgi:hypothetical protein
MRRECDDKPQLVDAFVPSRLVLQILQPFWAIPLRQFGWMMDKSDPGTAMFDFEVAMVRKEKRALNIVVE